VNALERLGHLLCGTHGLGCNARDRLTEDCKTFPEQITGMVAFGILNDGQARVLLERWNEVEGDPVREPLPDVLLLDVFCK